MIVHKMEQMRQNGQMIEVPQQQLPPTIAQNVPQGLPQQLPQGMTGNMPQGIPQEQQQMPVEPQGQDPFAMSQFGDSGMSDAPINYGGGMADFLLNDNEVPEDIKKKYWSVFHKDNVLTFLDEERKTSKLLNFDIMKIDILNSMPYYDYTFKEELLFDTLRGVYETKLDRALGFKGQNMKNERIILQSQFSEQRQISEMGNGGMVKEGFFKRLLGRR